MFGVELLNAGSILFGLIAWGLPVVHLARHNRADNRNRVIFSVASVSACAISLCMQILYGNHLVKKEDWSALMDTSDAVAFVSVTLLVVTIFLNFMAWVVYYKKRK